MIIGIGSDICRIDRIEKSLEKFGQRFEQKCFTENERLRAQKSKGQAAAVYAKRFAAKEAFVKAIGSDLKNHFSWQDIEVLNTQSGKPIINLSPKACKMLETIIPKGYETNIFLTMSDDYPNAIAFVVINAEVVLQK